VSIDAEVVWSIRRRKPTQNGYASLASPTAEDEAEKKTSEPNVAPTFFVQEARSTPAVAWLIVSCFQTAFAKVVE
jgi:hypothetical protein